MLRLIREPLVVFVLFGAAVFVIDGWRGEPDVELAPADVADDRVIVLDERALGAIDGQLRASLEREPSAQERDDAVRGWIETEVLVREAQARGLAADDPVVRAHLAQKMRFVLDARQVPETPDDEALRALFEAHRADWVVDPRLTLRQVFVAGTDDESRERAQALLAELEAGTDPVDMRARSDAPPGGPVLRGRSPERLQELYGEPFVEDLDTVDLDTWTLRASPQGWHAVRVERRRDGRQLTFDEARDRVLARWMADRIEQAGGDAVDDLVRSYRVEGWPP